MRYLLALAHRAGRGNDLALAAALVARRLHLLHKARTQALRHNLDAGPAADRTLTQETKEGGGRRAKGEGITHRKEHGTAPDVRSILHTSTGLLTC